MRTFIAIEVPAEVRTGCREIITSLRAIEPRVRWARPENMHLTLRFLGDIDESVGYSILNTAPEAAETISPFRLSARGLGCFPGPHKPSVVWLGVHADGDGLFRLQEAVESAARAAGLERERRSFKPHLTLGRIRPSATALSWSDLVAAHASFDAGAWMVRDVALFSSELHPAGARYTRLAAAPLGITPAGTSE